MFAELIDSIVGLAHRAKDKVLSLPGETHYALQSQGRFDRLAEENAISLADGDVIQVVYGC